MENILKNHPFAVEAYFESSVVFTFAVPKEEVQYLIPECLSLDTLHDRWAFIAVAMVQTKSLRPKRFPKFLGNDFFLIGYRIFVRYTTSSGKKLRGLYILKSETDKQRMQLLGNLFTHYNYTTTDIRKQTENNLTSINSLKSGFTVAYKIDDANISLPEKSPFIDWKEARKFAGPLPFTFTYNERTKKVLIIEGIRQHWQPAPIKVLNYHFSFIDSLNLKGIHLANAFVIHDIPYCWKKGKMDRWVQ